MAIGERPIGSVPIGPEPQPFDPLGFVLEYRKLGGFRQCAFTGDTYVINLMGPEPNEAREYWTTKMQFMGKEERDAIAKALVEVLPL